MAVSFQCMTKSTTNKKKKRKKKSGIRKCLSLLICQHWAQIIYIFLISVNKTVKKGTSKVFPGGPVVKTSPSNAGSLGSIPCQGAKIQHAS